MIGDADREFDADEGARILAERPPHPQLSPDPLLPDDTRLSAACSGSAAGRGAGVCLMWRG